MCCDVPYWRPPEPRPIWFLRLRLMVCEPVRAKFLVADKNKPLAQRTLPRW